MTVDWKEKYVSNFIPKSNSNGILIRIHSYHNFVLGLDFLIKWTYLIYNLLSLSFSYFKVYYEILKISIWIFYFLRQGAETVFIQFSNIYDYSNFFFISKLLSTNFYGHIFIQIWGCTRPTATSDMSKLFLLAYYYRDFYRIWNLFFI